ncbi:MAG: hypothetical protein ACRCR9_01290 [Chitinophagaceae bacterium]
MEKPKQEHLITTPQPSISSHRVPTPAVASGAISSDNFKFSSLQNLHEQYRKNKSNPKEIIPISIELLELYKKEYIDILESKKDPALLAFQQMQISHKQNNQIELFTDTLFNKHFLDDVKDEFHTLLEHRFKQSIILSTQIDKSLQMENISSINIKTQLQIFDKLAQQYSLLKTLIEEDIGLHIDYNPQNGM